MNKREAVAIAGTLSSPSKMPCHGYSIPATSCVTGSKLNKVAGSVCFGCYALKGNYRFPGVKAGLAKRLEAITKPEWEEAMITLITAAGETHFRWHDSGDIQSVDHFTRICRIAARLPKVQMWIPTREYKMVQDYVSQGGEIPANLIVRFSAHMVDAAPPTGYGFPTSSVHSHSEKANPLQMLSSIPSTSHLCPAPKQGNKCGDCRACWSPKVSNVSYTKH